MSLIGTDNYAHYHPILTSGTFGESGSQIKIVDPSNNSIWLGSPSTDTLDFVDSLSDNTYKIVYQYSGAPHYAVFLKKSDGTYRFGFFDGTHAYSSTEAEAAAYSEADVDAVLSATALLSNGQHFVPAGMNYDAEWPAAPAPTGGANGDPFVTPILC